MEAADAEPAALPDDELRLNASGERSLLWALSSACLCRKFLKLFIQNLCESRSG